jgi:hypothetical protein
MRRDYFELAVENVGWVADGGEPKKPTVNIGFRGPEELLRERLTDVEGNLLDAAETDVSFRLHDAIDAPGVTGVVAVTNRLTGDFIMELNEDADDVLTFIRAAREFGRKTDERDGRYQVNVSIDGDHVVTYEKSTFLVYDAEGNLLRGRSLIPSGVEL